MLDRLGTAFPWGTLTVNILGSLLIGVIMELVGQRVLHDPVYRLLLVTGFLGGFTTFSALSYETASLVEDAAYLRAGAYLLGSNLLAISACFAGIWMVRRLA